VAPTGGIGERYATQVGALWTGLARTLAELEQLAGDPVQLDDEESLDLVRRLQYRLHSASEHAYGLAPPAGIEPVHAELAAALAGARDATAELVEAVDEGGVEAALPFVHEWRGALFRVRLARLRLSAPSTHSDTREPEAERSFRRPLLAFSLTAVGSVVFAAGALTGPWPLWAAGLLAVCASLIAYKP
jgi:hypothetical protein